MKALLSLARAMPLTGRTWLVLAVILAVGLVALRLGFRWDPFGLDARRLERAQARALEAGADAAARRLEVEGERETHHRLDIHHTTVRAADAATAVAIQQSGVADDAFVPLDPARAARLGGHDDELCRIAPDLDGCAAASGPG